MSASSVTQYDREADGFRFYVMATTMPQVMLKRNAIVPHAGSGMGWVYDHKTAHIRPDLKQGQAFLEDEWYVEASSWTKSARCL